MNDNESDYSLRRRLICAPLSTPLRFLVDEVEVSLQYLILVRVLDIVTSLMSG